MYSRLMRALSRSFGLRVFRLLCRDLKADAGYAVGSGGIDLRQLAESDVLLLCSDADLDLRPESVRAAYARGDLCIAALDGGRLVGYCWLAFEPLPHLDGVWVGFGPDVAWTYKSLVRSSHRGRGIARLLYRYADERCRERGRSASIICVESHNSPSIAAARRAGYEDDGWSAYLARNSGLRAWLSPRARRRGVAFFRPA
jgi:GNAT superfamily N-acetyltransferase